MCEDSFQTIQVKMLNEMANYMGVELEKVDGPKLLLLNPDSFP